MKDRDWPWTTCGTGPIDDEGPDTLRVIPTATPTAPGLEVHDDAECNPFDCRVRQCKGCENVVGECAMSYFMPELCAGCCAHVSRVRTRAITEDFDPYAQV